ncbi:MAG: hypothetical protein O3B70_08030 [Bacteroidetes bacterium]|nr:hypothetical protein [Bacteroidota bacterium]MDA1241868.1 hypothetical protein [Bacteroidota bacterium]
MCAEATLVGHSQATLDSSESTLESYFCSVTDLEDEGAQFSEGPRFVHQDVEGFLWFFSDLAAYRFNGTSYRKILYSDVFQFAQGSHEYLRAALRLPGGEFGLQFGDSPHGMPLQDTLCALDPIRLAASQSPNLPPLGPDDVLFDHMHPSDLQKESLCFLVNRTSGTSRVVEFDEPTQRWVTRYQCSSPWQPHGLYESSDVGLFLLLEHEQLDSMKTVHCQDGRCITSPASAQYMVPQYESRRSHVHNLWFGPRGDVLFAAWDRPDLTGSQQDPYMYRKADGRLMPATQSPLGVDWSTFLPLNPDYRATEARLNPWSNHIWVLDANRLSVYNIQGQCLIHHDLPASDRLTMGLHDLLFLDSQQAIVLSSFGLFHVAVEKSVFRNHNYALAPEGFNLGCRDIVSWNGTLLLASDATGVYEIEAHGLNPLWRTDNNCTGFYADGDTLWMAYGGGLWKTADADSPLRTELASSCTGQFSWGLKRMSDGTFYVMRDGLEAIPQGGQESLGLGVSNNTYDVLELDGQVLVAGAQALQVFKPGQSSLGPASTLYPELRSIQSTCYSILRENDDNIWFCTQGQGLVLWQPKSSSLAFYNSDAGLPSNTVYGALVASDGMVWASTNQGLISVHPETGAIRVFGEKRGLVETEFNRMSFSKHDDGRMYFGGLGSVTSFDPVEAHEADAMQDLAPRIERIDQHKSDEHTVSDVTLEFRESGQIHMGSGDDFLSIHPIVPDMTGTSHSFSYRWYQTEEIQDLDLVEWSPLLDEVFYVPRLSQGQWIVEIKAKSSERGWLPMSLKIPVFVDLPLFMNPWFQLGCIANVFGLYVLGAWFRNVRLSRRNKTLEATVQERTTRLRKALAQKDSFLAETHHRVKNNLQLISSLMDLQAVQIEDETIRREFGQSKSRIDSIALIHKHIYTLEEGNSMGFREYLTDLTSLIAVVHTPNPDTLRLKLTGDELLAKREHGLPLGMLFNELLTNTAKHALDHEGTTQVHLVVLDMGEGRVQITYDDHGPGLPEDFDFEHASSLGLRLVGRFVKQLGGTVMIDAEQRSRLTFNLKVG